eukprot:CAMPEP_0184865208 /NCGR_PEP_ID=MMETSP0580-20130426/17315_1 /TAXON_ID=1118495 /ORGANISM="Dactyliosolen fragilissimus" /LENGTH=988 /DNA_ID=CAMNT_0027364305 /DNA_START=27 /DNA_END=2993 /DNA_ORIENTATION=+
MNMTDAMSTSSFTRFRKSLSELGQASSTLGRSGLSSTMNNSSLNPSSAIGGGIQSHQQFQKQQQQQQQHQPFHQFQNLQQLQTQTKSQQQFVSNASNPNMDTMMNDASSSAAAHRILSSRGIDSASLSRDSLYLETRALEGSMMQVNPDEKCEYDDDTADHRLANGTFTVEKSLDEHRSRFVARVIENTQMNTRKKNEDRFNQHMLDNWNQRKSAFLASCVGGRPTLGMDGTNTGTRIALQGRHGNTSILASSFHTSNTLNNMENSIDEEEKRLAEVHLSILCESRHLPSQQSPSLSLKEQDLTLERLLTSLNSQNGGVDKAYLQTTRLLKSILQSSSSSKLNSVQNPALMAKGTLQFLSHQYRDFIIDRVKDNHVNMLPNSSQVSFDAIRGGSLAANVRNYVRLELGRDNVLLNDNAIWRSLYHCLRSGDAHAAKEILSTTKTIEPIIERVITHLATTHQQNESSIFDNSKYNYNQPPPSITPPSKLPPNVEREISELYYRSKTHAITNQIDQYKIAVLALLSQEEPLTSSGTNIIQTIEDFIFATLWHATLSHHSKDSKNCGDVVIELAKTIYDLGPDHFSDNGIPASSSVVAGWTYATPLLSCFQFQSALIHLANAGGNKGLTIATHIALAIVGSGGVIEDYGNTDTNEEQSSSTGDNNKTYVSSNDILGHFLVMHASNLQEVSPQAALEYLVRIPDDKFSDGQQIVPIGSKRRVGKKAKSQIARLICKTREFATLAGHISPDGDRNSSNAALDKYLSPLEVSDVLATAAKEMQYNGSLTDAAELFVLAGRFGSLISLFNQELSQLLVITEQDNDDIKQKRKFWYDAAINFHSTYLSQGRTHVVQMLEKEGNTWIGHAFQMILNLMVFFDRCYGKMWESAWEFIDQLDLFPKTDAELSIKVESFQRLNINIKEVFPNVIINSIQSLYEQYFSLKGEIGANSSTIRQRLNELKTSVRLIVTYSGLIDLNLSADAKSRISQMEAYMV